MRLSYVSQALGSGRAETVECGVTRDHYILNEDGSISVVDLLTWAKWFEVAQRHIAQDLLPGDVRVSTVFLGIDHNFALEGPPLLFETMIFGGEHDSYQDRYATRDESLVGHRKALALAKGEPGAA
jgi:hypothetical protein